MARPVFKDYSQNQLTCFPADLGTLIAESSPARIVSMVVDKLDVSEVVKTYKFGGASSYHPKMMLKIVFFAYMNNVFSCRKIERQLKENVNYMWLSGMQFPDYHTINNFRSLHLKDTITKLFTQVVLMLCDMGCLSLEESYVDGTKIEARPNKYTFVWKKNIIRNRNKLLEKIKNILAQIDEGIAQDLYYENDDAKSTPVFDKETLLKKIGEINEENLDKSKKKALKQLTGKHLPKLDDYDESLEILGERNSYSKTDHDATFMRMKEDAMNNGQTKPGYNLQIGTSKQFVTNFDLFPNPTDTLTLEPFVKKQEELYPGRLKELTADSGYGSEENYAMLEQRGITAYVKYNYFHKEQHKPQKDNPFAPQNLYYNAQDDYYVCPMGQHMTHVRSRKETNERGFTSYTDIYQARNCAGCPLLCCCHKSKGDRVINVNHNLNRLKKQAFDLLTSPDGLVRRSRRPIEPEAVFGQIKTCMGYKRFRHFGIGKCYMDFGILAIAFNLLKLSRLKGGNPPEKLKSWICGFILLFFWVKRANYFQNCFPAENNKKVCLKNLKLL
ncbi:IS1182 family transposase, partial [bacterium]|nr:IS1182 family transposase [bacterium]